MHAKAITDSVGSIVDDIERLKEQAPENAKKYVLFAFYPMYSESYATFNGKHLPTISRVSGKEVTSPNRSIQVRGVSFDIYLIEL
jgi:hypothetical protein